MNNDFNIDELIKDIEKKENLKKKTKPTNKDEQNYKNKDKDKKTINKNKKIINKNKKQINPNSEFLKMLILKPSYLITTFFIFLIFLSLIITILGKFM